MLNPPILLQQVIYPDPNYVPGISSSYFSMRLEILTKTPIDKARLKLYVVGNPPSPKLTLKSRSTSEVVYDLDVPLSAYSPVIEWEIPTLDNYLSVVYVLCSQFTSNTVTFKKL
jgi:hypothetical protein